MITIEKCNKQLILERSGTFELVEDSQMLRKLKCRAYLDCAMNDTKISVSCGKTVTERSKIDEKIFIHRKKRFQHSKIKSSLCVLRTIPSGYIPYNIQDIFCGSLYYTKLMRRSRISYNYERDTEQLSEISNRPFLL